MAGADTQGLVKDTVAKGTRLVRVHRRNEVTKESSDVLVPLEDLDIEELEQVVERRQEALLRSAREAKQTIMRTTEQCGEMCESGSVLFAQIQQQERQET